MKEIYCDTDSAYIMKQHLNSIYGKAVTDMNKDYIVVHSDNSDGTPSTSIIFKSHICAVRKDEDDSAYILIDGGMSIYTRDNYVDIVKQLV